MGLEKATLQNISISDKPKVPVLFNPTEYAVDHGAQWAELPVPGLPTPLLQFVRGDASTLSLELLLDARELGSDVEADLAELRQFVEIDAELHAPPVCQFDWGSQSFQGVVTSFKESRSLFDEEGNAIRARVTISLKSYGSPSAHHRDLKLASPDRTRVRVMREGETLASIAHDAYGNSRLWRAIAEANGIDRPRFVPPGTELVLPAL